jgi:hypothetical protein
MTVSFALEDLNQFSGTERYYRSSLFAKDIVHTDGVQFIAERGAAWMIDVIISQQIHPKVKAEPFQAWEFFVTEKHECRVICTDGNEHVVTSQIIPYTDLPFTLTLWLELGSIDMVDPMWVIMLPGER